MNLRDYIEAGIKQKGTGRALADALQIGSNELSDAKGHRRGLPNHACVKLAAIIKADPITIIAASELATERKEEKRAFWMQHAHAASFATLVTLAAFTAEKLSYILYIID